MESREFSRRGSRKLTEGDYEAALDLFQKALRKDPLNEEAHQGLGFLYQQKGSYDKAMEEFDKALRINPSSSGAYCGMGFVRLAEGLYDKSVEYFRRALEFDKRNAFALQGLGQVYRYRGEYDSSIKAYRKAIKISPDKAAFFTEMGSVYMLCNDKDSAASCFRKSLKIDPGNVFAHIGLGEVYLSAGSFNRASREFSHAVQADPQNVLARNKLGFMLLDRGDIDSAYEIFSTALRKGITDEDTLHGAGRALWMKGKRDEAIEELKKVIELNPSKSSVYRDLGTIYLEKKDYDNAVRCYKKAIKLGESKEELLKDKDADLCMKMGDIDIAVARLVRASEKELNSPPKAGRQFKKRFRIKLVRMPFFDTDVCSTELNTILLPPLAMGQISSFLRSRGIELDQDDLNIKIYNYNYRPELKCRGVDERVFFDEPRISRYISGSRDHDMDSIMEKVDEMTDFKGYNMILLSVPQGVTNSSHLTFTLSLAHFLKKKYGPTIIVGGDGIKTLGNYRSKDIDLIVVGKNGERALFDILSVMACNGSLSSIRGLKINRRTKEAFSTHSACLVNPDFNGLPLEMYEYKNQLEKYDKDTAALLSRCNKMHDLILPFRFIYGCPYQCSFCGSSGSSITYLFSPQRAVDYLCRLKEAYNPMGFMFFHETINFSKKYINDLCDEMIKRKLRIHWSDSARCNNLDRDLIFKMKEAGCVRLIFGMETASTRLLKYIRKGISLKQLERVFEWADSAGLWIGLETISGIPYEEEHDIKATIDFLRKNKRYVNRIYYNTFHLDEGSNFLLNAKIYRIKNVSSLNAYRDGVEYGDYVSYRFDETEGLGWRKKKEQIVDSYNRLVGSVGRETFPWKEEEHFLFFLYSILEKKSDILSVFSRVRDVKYSLLQKMTKSLSRAG